MRRFFNFFWGEVQKETRFSLIIREVVANSTILHCDRRKGWQEFKFNAEKKHLIPFFKRFVSAQRFKCVLPRLRGGTFSRTWCSARQGGWVSLGWLGLMGEGHGCVSETLLPGSFLGFEATIYISILQIRLGDTIPISKYPHIS